VPVFRLGEDETLFPPVELAEPDGVLAVGGDLSPRRLLTAYSQGIFPWYSDDMPIVWHSPDPRFSLLPEALHVPQSLKKVLKRKTFEVRLDTSFDAVIDACAKVKRPGQEGTWITSEMKRAYRKLHQMGFAHSAEAWQDDTLVGGLYGVSLGSVFFGESMFARVPDASKVAFVVLVEQLREWGFTLIDCQQETGHLARFGATAWPRPEFVKALEEGLLRQTRKGPWRLSPSPS